MQKHETKNGLLSTVIYESKSIATISEILSVRKMILYKLGQLPKACKSIRSKHNDYVHTRLMESLVNNT